MFAGHSLGGTAAFCLASIFNGSRSVSLNPGAAPTNPVLTGPGMRSTVYHIVGDLIVSSAGTNKPRQSSHMSNTAANVIRIRKKDSIFGNVKPHDSTNILANSGDWRIVSADEEDQLYQQWMDRPHIKYLVKPIAQFYSKRVELTFSDFTAWLKNQKVITESPIPGSTRWYEYHPNETSPTAVSPAVQEINEVAQKNLSERRQREKLKRLYLFGGGSSRQFAQ